MKKKGLRRAFAPSGRRGPMCENRSPEQEGITTRTEHKSVRDAPACVPYALVLWWGCVPQRPYAAAQTMIAFFVRRCMRTDARMHRLDRG